MIAVIDEKEAVNFAKKRIEKLGEKGALQFEHLKAMRIVQQLSGKIREKQTELIELDAGLFRKYGGKNED